MHAVSSSGSARARQQGTALLGAWCRGMAPKACVLCSACQPETPPAASATHPLVPVLPAAPCRRRRLAFLPPAGAPVPAVEPGSPHGGPAGLRHQGVQASSQHTNSTAPRTQKGVGGGGREGPRRQRGKRRMLRWLGCPAGGPACPHPPARPHPSAMRPGCGSLPLPVLSTCLPAALAQPFAADHFVPTNL